MPTGTVFLHGSMYGQANNHHDILVSMQHSLQTEDWKSIKEFNVNGRVYPVEYLEDNDGYECALVREDLCPLGVFIQFDDDDNDPTVGTMAGYRFYRDEVHYD